TPPEVAVNGADDVGQGRLLPTQAVDQLAATLATWFGVSASDLPLVVPHIGNYTIKDLGFFA
ncbi:MAG TPA: Tat pathway signal protein, partial [Burkholderiaceae bacterium]|nr:Tat pathway signal protein [Burkholderiaceae bacterium]